MTTNPRLAWPPPPAVRQLSTKPGAVRVRKHLQRRKAGIHCLTVQMSEPDLQSLAKLPPQADPAVERTIGAVLNAAYGTHGRGRERLAASSEAPGDVCALCGGPGVLWHGLLPCSRGGKTFLAHPRCFQASGR